MEKIKREIDEGINCNYRPELSFFSHNVVIYHVYVVFLYVKKGSQRTQNTQVRHLKRGLSSFTGTIDPMGCGIVKANQENTNGCIRLNAMHLLKQNIFVKFLSNDINLILNETYC